jgi:uncharacterized protein YpiB (UPF0302 family)
MFDKGYFEEMVKSVKSEQRQDILALVDFALDTNDKVWFDELMTRLRRVNC